MYRDGEGRMHCQWSFGRRDSCVVYGPTLDVLVKFRDQVQGPRHCLMAWAGVELWGLPAEQPSSLPWFEFILVR